MKRRESVGESGRLSDLDKAENTVLGILKEVVSSRQEEPKAPGALA